MTLPFKSIQHLLDVDLTKVSSLEAAEVCFELHKHYSKKVEIENDEAVMRRMERLLGPKAFTVIEGGR